MSARAALVPRLAGVVAAALLLTGCTSGSDDGDGDGDAAAPTPTPGASTGSPAEGASPADPPPAPDEGACYRLEFDDAVAPTTGRDPVPCRSRHTAETFHVGRLETVADGTSLDLDSSRLQEQVATACPKRFGRFVGGSTEQQRLSMLRPIWFTPSEDDFGLGADWFRCDAVAVARDGELARLGGRLKGVLGSGDGRDRYGMCGTAEPGTDGFRRVICSTEHTWRAVATVPFEEGRYPGQQRVREAGEGPCEDAGREAADDPLSFRWGYEWPTRDQWRAGQTWGICWVPT
ncbi:septum formation family protein [Nocardioides sp. GCM10027113]|uniref:septum formation family protein n=1 Tax=unclassified Nocardioides TaxID=2615069 RepID=UPI003613F1E3